MDHAAPEQEVHVHVGEYEEKTWVEMKEDEEDDINCLGMFDDPGKLLLFKRLHTTELLLIISQILWTYLFTSFL